jgi:hypothetical protein
LATLLPPRKSQGVVLLPWLVRAVWLALPFTAGAALAGALDDRSAAVGLVAAVLLWTGWAAGVLAVLLPRPAGLTALRVLAPAATAAALWSGSAAGAVVPAVATALVLAPETGAWLVNGAAYGYERRFPLRAPGPLLLGPIVLAWALVVAGVVAGPLLLATRQWVAGTVALVVGLPLALALLRSLHALSGRWAVLVPAGLVLKDHLALRDPVLFRRQDVELLRGAPAESDGADLTVRAPGLALEVSLREAYDVVLAQPGRRSPGQPGKLRRFLFTPTRPGALLADAGGRRIRVG